MADVAPRTRLLPAERAALDELHAWLHERFPGRVAELTLFGSRARGEGNEDSDLDVLVAIDGLTSAERREIWHFSGDLLTRHDVIVATLAMSREHMQALRDGERLIAREIDRDGVPA